MKTIKKVFALVGGSAGAERSEAVAAAKNVTHKIVTEIVSNKNAAINMIDLKIFDDYTYYHSVNVAILSIIAGVATGLGKSDLYKLGLGALLHDIGKVFVPKEILDKQGKLTDEEFAMVRVHSQKGSDYLRERWDVPYESIFPFLRITNDSTERAILTN